MKTKGIWAHEGEQWEWDYAWEIWYRKEHEEQINMFENFQNKTYYFVFKTLCLHDSSKLGSCHDFVTE